ncbi:Uma2 family endonuclease [Nocardia cyriacigeorgica]|uniref:Uma2 family endonuclease n=1 Tax=Nocardia cyriacigeorgica TaxID=135487 RepID=A0A5R8P049_9NOCA|nr:Uma2 family endonuclease [Nocardia cyriacigeorgica]TLF82463.1 Uma2 family endonuclease [Nocardia cyriacigeorgica]
MTINPSYDLPHEMTEEQYRLLPADIAREVEVVHGHVIICESPVPEHNRVARRLAGALEQLPSTEPCMRVETYIDMVLWRVPKFTFRRPDVIVYRCLPERGAKPEAGDALIVVEVSSPSTAAEDLLDKKVQYARAGIPLYLVISLDPKFEIEEVREFRLDAHAAEYRLHSLHRDGFLRLEHVILGEIGFEDLTR